MNDFIRNTNYFINSNGYRRWFKNITIKIIILDCIHRPCIFQVEQSHNVSETGSVSVLRCPVIETSSF
jgi:hypothetical protein